MEQRPDRNWFQNIQGRTKKVRPCVFGIEDIIALMRHMVAQIVIIVATIDDLNATSSHLCREYRTHARQINTASVIGG